VFCNGCGAPLSRDLRPDTRKPATIVFNDVVDSTALGERLEPETVRRVMARYFECVSGVLERHGGTVEKFIGDAAMAVFGVPLAQEDHALRAVRAAGELQQAVAALNRDLERDFGVRIQTRTGVCSGEVVTGDPAGGRALVTGEAVNIAARLEQSAPAGETLIAEPTRQLVEQAVELQPVEPLGVKGRSEPLSAWRLVDVRSKAGQLARTLDQPMLGRDAELRVLTQALEEVLRDRSAQLATVLGSAGIGKSRLAREFRGDAGDAATVLVGSCLPYGEGITYWPLVEIVRQAVGEQPRAEVARLLAGDPHADLISERVAELAGSSEDGDLGNDLNWAVRRLFEALAKERPLVVVFEDIHWAEAPLLDTIEYLAQQARHAPMMLLCLARPELLEQRPGWPIAGERTSLVSLEPLSQNQTRTLVDRALDDQAVGESVRAELVQRAEGNPLFVEQMLAMLREDETAEVTIPPTIQALLAARLDRLPLDQLELVGAASVVGNEFWPRAVAALSPAAVGELDGALSALEGRELIQAGATTITGEQGFGFRHALIRDAAYESLTKQARAELHERFANWMEDDQRERLAELEALLGYHLEQAHRYRVELAPVDTRSRALAQRASRRLGSAGRRAARSRTDVDAVNLLSRAGDLLPRESTERLELLPLIGESLEGTANHARAGEIYAEALEAAIAAGDGRVEGWARLGSAHVWFVAQPEVPPAEIVAEAERAIPLLEQAGDERGLADAWRLVGEARMYEGQAAAGQQALERALEHLGPDASTRSLNANLFALGVCLLDGPAHLDRAAEFATEWLEHARAGALRSLEADMLHVLGVAEGRRGHLERARRTLRASTEISQELGLAYMAQWSQRSLGNVELAAGEPQAAEQALRSSYEVLDEMGLKSSLGETAIPLADALARQGRDEQARRMLETVDEHWASDASIEAPRLAVRARLLAAEGWDRHAERAAQRALRLVRRTDWSCLQAEILLTHAEVLAAGNRGDVAAAALREALEVAGRKGYAAASLRATAELERLGAPAERVP
jgi:class 3 adenylate cyclase/tetratricopeptide (TPR) repeat protein